MMLYYFVSTKDGNESAVSAEELNEKDCDKACQIITTMLRIHGRELAHITNLPLDEQEEAAMEQYMKTFGRKILMTLANKFALGIGYGINGEPAYVSVGQETLTEMTPEEIAALEKLIKNFSTTFRKIFNVTIALGYRFGQRERERTRNQAMQN